MDAKVKTSTDVVLTIRLETTDTHTVEHVKTRIKDELGIEENDQLLINLYHNQPLTAQHQLKDCADGRLCMFYVVSRRSSRQTVGNRNNLVAFLNDGVKHLFKLQLVASRKIRMGPVDHILQRAQVCIEELNFCKSDMHIRTFVRHVSKTAMFDPVLIGGALMHVHIVFEGLKERVSALNTDMDLVRHIRIRKEKIESRLKICDQRIDHLEKMAEKLHWNVSQLKKYSDKLQQKIETMFDDAILCEIKGDVAASAKIKEVREEMNTFITNLVKTILCEAGGTFSTKRLLQSSSTTENIEIKQEKQSAHYFKTEIENVRPMADRVTDKVKEFEVYYQEWKKNFEAQKEDWNREESRLNDEYENIRKKKKDLETELDAGEKLKRDVRERMEKLERRNPLWTAAAVFSAFVLSPIAGISLGLIGLLGNVNWNNLDDVKRAFDEVDNDCRRIGLSIYEVEKRIESNLNKRHKLNTERKETEKTLGEMQRPGESLPRTKDVVNRLKYRVADVVKTFQKFEIYVSSSLNVDELVGSHRSFDLHEEAIDDDIRYTKEEETLILAEKLDYVKTIINNMLKLSEGLLKVLEHVDKLIESVQQSEKYKIGAYLEEFVAVQPHATEIGVLKSKADSLKKDIASMDQAFSLMDETLRAFTDKLGELEDITTLYHELWGKVTKIHWNRNKPVLSEGQDEQNDDSSIQTEGGSRLMSIDADEAEYTELKSRCENDQVADATPSDAQTESRSTDESRNTEGAVQAEAPDEDGQRLYQHVRNKLNEFIDTLLDL